MHEEGNIPCMTIFQLIKTIFDNMVLQIMHRFDVELEYSIQELILNKKLNWLFSLLLEFVEARTIDKLYGYSY